MPRAKLPEQVALEKIRDEIRRKRDSLHNQLMQLDEVLEAVEQAIEVTRNVGRAEFADNGPGE